MDVTRVEYYYCIKCSKEKGKPVFHNRYRKTDGKKIKIYMDHAEYAKDLLPHEEWKIRFKENWQRTAKQAKKTGKAVGTPKKDKRKKNPYDFGK